MLKILSQQAQQAATLYMSNMIYSVLTTDKEFVKKFTQAKFLKTKFYPKVRKSQWAQGCDKTAWMMVKIQ